MLHLEDHLLWMLRLQQMRYWFDCSLHPVFRCPSIDYLSKYLILSMWDYHFHRFVDLQWFQMHTTLAAEKGTINVMAEKKDSKAIFTIKDTGRGIDPEILPKLFTKFATKSSSGTGLGLFISKSIIEAHGGKIRAENSPDGIGATFSFSVLII